MKTIAVIVLLSCCALAQDKTATSTAEGACGPQDAKFEVKADKSQHPAPTPEEGKALIYFITDGHLTTPIGVDGKWVGSVNDGKYFIMPVESGEHHLCAMLQSFPAQKVLTRKHPLEQVLLFHYALDVSSSNRTFLLGLAEAKFHRMQQASNY